MDKYKLLANAFRVLSSDMIDQANSGHPGLPLGMSDVVSVLYQDILRFNPSEPNWFHRDRFVLSAGHGSALLYSVLHLFKYKGLGVEALRQFRQLNSATPGHPERGHTEGVEVTTGPLGQGVSNSVGIALGLKKQHSPASVYALVGDGCLMEGVSYESLNLAGHWGLDNLYVLWDDNGITIDGSTSLSTSENQLKRFENMGFAVFSCDGHNTKAIQSAFSQAQAVQGKPKFIAFKTIIGYGATQQGTADIHGSPLGTKETTAMRERLGMGSESFTVPSSVYSLCESIRLSKIQAAQALTLPNPPQLGAISSAGFIQLAESMYKNKTVAATRTVTGKVADELIRLSIPFVAGSADLTPSNNTKVKTMQAIQKADYSGQYVHYGIREHGMASIMNGLATLGTQVVYGGTFLVFSDYMKPAIRLSALMNLPVIYVFTHDSIGLGEDGPTHQPIEQLQQLRLIPNLLVLRPMDMSEAVECWHIALQQTSRPTALILSRQNTHILERNYRYGEVHKGGYIVADYHPTLSGKKVQCLATGTEVGLAISVKRHLESKGVNVKVISVPSVELLMEQPKAYQSQVLDDSIIVTLEASTPAMWGGFMQALFHPKRLPPMLNLGIKQFGYSAPQAQVYQELGLTVESVSQSIINIIGEYK